MKPLGYFLFSALCLALLVCGALCVTDCRPACDASLPTITTAQGYEADASKVVAAVKSEVAGLPLSADQRAKVDAAIANCEKALTGVNAALIAASSACSATDAIGVFKAFVAAWDALEPVVLPLITGLIATRPAEQQTTYLPLIVRKARGQL